MRKRKNNKRLCGITKNSLEKQKNIVKWQGWLCLIPNKIFTGLIILDELLIDHFLFLLGNQTIHSEIWTILSHLRWREKKWFSQNLVVIKEIQYKEQVNYTICIKLNSELHCILLILSWIWEVFSEYLSNY